jgi:signal peptidase I
MDSQPTQVKNNSFIELCKFICIVALIFLPIRYFVAKPFIVNGASMDPTFVTGEYLIVDQLTYHFEKPKRGEVIVFKYPYNEEDFYIKRVIGLPGETVESRDGIIIIYGIIQQYGLANLFISTMMAGVLLFIMGLTGIGSFIRFIPIAIVIGFILASLTGAVSARRTVSGSESEVGGSIV